MIFTEADVPQGFDPFGDRFNHPDQETDWSDRDELLAWVLRLFYDEYCGECGGDWFDHDVVAGPLGLPFALCVDAEP